MVKNIYLAIAVILCMTLCLNFNEGYVNNKPPKNYPDDIQYLACHDHSNKYVGLNNYKLNKHGISEPLQGAYSYFLDEYKLRNYDELFHSPICEKQYNFKDISNIKKNKGNKSHFIIDHSDTNTAELLKKEEDYDKNAVKDPYYSYVNPNYIGNTLTYSDEINELFLKSHRSHDDETLMHRLDNSVYSN